MGTTYFSAHTGNRAPLGYRGHRRRRATSTHRVGLAVLGAIWLGLGTFGGVATAGVVL